MSRSGKRSAGFSLVELLVGVAVGALAVTMALMFFVNNKRDFLVQQEATRLQENQRFAVQFLTRDIRSAGYRGCAGGSGGALTNTLKNSSNLENDFDAGGIDGFDDVTTTLPTLLSNLLSGKTPNAGTDVLVLRGPEGDSFGVSAPNTSTTVFATAGVSGIDSGDYLMISDCQKARIFQAGTITSGTGAITHPEDTGDAPGNSDYTWGGTSAPADELFDVDSEIVRVGTFTYFISDGPGGEPSLYRKTNAEPAEELVEGVEDMQVLYGVNTDADDDGTPDSFVDASSVSNWDNVTAVRIWLMLRGFEDNMAESESYSYVNIHGSTVTDTPTPLPDKRLRRSAVLTASLRNRLP